MNSIIDFTNNIIPILRGRLVSMHAQHIFIVHGKHSYDICGAAAIVNEALLGLNITITDFEDFSANPKDEEAQQGLSLVLLTKPDLIIGIGGGSAMDMAKLIRHYAAEQGYIVPLWTIPTTAGTGAEATHFAVVYRDGKKYSVEADDILPDIVMLYPPFTYNNDAYLTACTGFDALAHAIEAFWNPNSTEVSDNYALRAIAHIHRQLPRCIKGPTDTFCRDDLVFGAYWAGRAINITKTTAPHAFSYAFTTHCGYPHGHAVAITFPYFAKLNMANHPKKEELRWWLGLSHETDMQQYFLNYVQSIGLGYCGTKGHDLRLLLSMVNLERLTNNPVKMTIDRMKELENYIKSTEI